MSKADDITKSFEQKFFEQFGERRVDLMTAGEYREWCEYLEIQSELAEDESCDLKEQ